MGKFRQLIDKKIPSGLSTGVTNARLASKDSAWSVSSTTQNQVDEIVKSINLLLLSFPRSSDFLGKNLKYPVKKKYFFSRLQRSPDLSKLREQVNKFAESTEITNPRKKIQKLLKRYPYLHDLRVINGVQIFNNTMQSGLNEKKLNALKGAVIETGGAINNGGMSLFNVTWFIKIYLRYLEFIKERYSHEYEAIRNNKHAEIHRVAEELNRVILQTTAMLIIKNKLGGLTMLNAKLKGSVYITRTITTDEIRAACSASLQGDLNREVGPGKTANSVLLVTMTLGLLFARIPMMRKLVSDILITIPDISKDLILQKNMISCMTYVTSFQLALSSGDAEESRDVANKLYNRCQNTISQHLEYTILTRPHEVDPFLKAAWIAKESNGLMRESDYRVRLEEANAYLKIVTTNRGRVKGAFELARQLQNDINYIMAEYGWSSG